MGSFRKPLNSFSVSLLDGIGGARERMPAMLFTGVNESLVLRLAP